MKITRSKLPFAIQLSLSAAVLATAAAHAQTATSLSNARTLDAISVIGVTENSGQIASPVSVVDRDALIERGAGTLGEALKHLPGVQSDTFGSGASRPIIRGQTAPRVKVLNDSSSVLDASDISPDHAVTADPLLGERIEVLRGPATLLYGGGAIGGVVNVLDGKIPERLPENGIEGRLVIRGNTAAKENAYGGAVSKQVGSHLVLHAEGSQRDSDDYRAPKKGTTYVNSTFSESTNGGVGASWVTDKGYVGLAYSYREDEYGLPGHSHDYEACHPHGSTLHCGDHDHEGHDHEHSHDHGHAATVDLKSERYDLRGEYRDPFAGISKIRFRSSYTDYRHHELDGDEVSTRFTNKGHESRVELEHNPFWGMHGVVGIQHSDTTFGATGLEAFLPTVDTRTTGLFLVEHFELNDQWHFEAGARHEWLKHTPVNDTRGRPGYDNTASSFSAAAIWSFTDELSLTFNASRSQRLPHAQELYARGVHLATNTYECGLVAHPLTCGGAENNTPISRETAQNFELMLRGEYDKLSFNASAYVNNVDNYTYARTLDRYEDFRLIKYTQGNARFRGFEGEVDYAFTDAFSATMFADQVTAKLSDGGGNLPRIAPRRVGTRLNYVDGSFSGELEYTRVGGQKKVAAFEQTTPSYNLVGMSLAYTMPDGRGRFFVRGDNLLDKLIWNHTSFLAHTVPMPGRNFTAGYSYTF